MNQDEKFSNVASELHEIFKYLDEDILNKLPKVLKEQVEKRRNPNYKFKLDKTRDLIDQDIMQETKQILSVMFLKYCCTEKEIDEILDIHVELERKEEDSKIGLEELQNIFNNNLSHNEQNNEEKQIVKTEETSWYSKLINKIKMIFKIKK